MALAARPSFLHTGLKAATSCAISSSRLLPRTGVRSSPTFSSRARITPITAYVDCRARSFHSAATARASAEPITTAQLGEGDRNEAAEQESLVQPPPPPVDASKSAFLGEADSNDADQLEHEINHDLDPPALDASKAAFLGEADSDDAFESSKDIEGVMYEALEEQAAYLGEGDDNQAVVRMRLIEGIAREGGRTRGPVGATTSTYNDGVAGGHVWSEKDATPSEADIKADRGESVVAVGRAAAAATTRLAKGLERLQEEVDDLKTIMRDHEGVERDKFRL